MDTATTRGISQSRFATSYEESPRGFRTTIQNIVKENHRLVWLVCASISLLSTRNLLVENNVHYPLQLYTIAFVTATAYVLCLHRFTGVAQGTGEVEERRKTTVPGTLLVAVAQCLAASSMLCMMQAILHFTNLPVLVMLTVSLPSPLPYKVLLTMLDNCLLY